MLPVLTNHLGKSSVRNQPRSNDFSSGRREEKGREGRVESRKQHVTGNAFLLSTRTFTLFIRMIHLQATTFWTPFLIPIQILVPIGTLCLFSPRTSSPGCPVLDSRESSVDIQVLPISGKAKKKVKHHCGLRGLQAQLQAQLLTNSQIQPNRLQALQKLKVVEFRL